MFGLLRKTVREENILPLTSVCNLNCIFCSNPQNPRGVETFTLPPLPLPLVRQLLPLLDPRRKIIIGEAASRFTEGEPLTHPYFWDIMEKLRHLYPDTLFQITTNGKLLKRAAVRRLAGLQPVELNLSLNSVTPRGRWLLMGDTRPEVVLEAVELLAAAGITYHGSIVALPHLTGWPDLRRTCAFLQEQGAATVRIFLPGFTKLACPELRFDPVSLYRQLEVFQREQEAIYRLPVMLEPFLGEDLQARVAGVLEGSPAQRAGIRRGEVIRRVNGKAVQSRVDAFRRVYHAVHPCLELSGRQNPVTIRKQPNDGAGLVMAYDLDWERVKLAGRLIRASGARRVLVLTSEWGLPRLRKVLPEWERGGIRVRLEAVPNTFFGGTIASAGLLTVLDFRKTLQRIVERDGDIYDLVLLPAVAFDARGRDLLGRPYSRLQSLTGASLRPI